ncbi:MAG: phosphoethanolamine--lipid A transferase [Steroidobacteraceae bacterium]
MFARTHSASRIFPGRPALHAETVILLVVIWMIVMLNARWWSALIASHSLRNPASWGFLAAVGIALVALHFAVLAPFMNRWTMRPLLSVIVVLATAAAYFTDAYSVMLDPTMIRNILETDVREASELVSLPMVGRVALGSALPLAFLWWVRVRQRPVLRAVLIRSGFLLASLAIAVLAILPVNRDLVSMMRNHHELRYLITPGNFLVGFARQSVRQAQAPSGPKRAVGVDARQRHPASVAGRSRVFVLIVGETARAQNFGLLGYPRDTTPELGRLDVTAFGNVRSCGTSTEVSVPCMFSAYGRADYDERLIRDSQGLLDVLVHAGLAVTWIDNQAGCKGVCEGAGIRTRNPDPALDPASCRDSECQDGILVRELEAELDGVTGNTVIVLHMMGNHGPAYYRRYPAEFRHFMPECVTAELRDCTREQIVNAYDNAIRYTDHVLASLIGVLQAHSAQVASALLYVSDHGESLGEAGLYLHGMPYAIAPDTQKHVPMVTWMSPEFAADQHVDGNCLKAGAGQALSHDNLFHSVLGVLDIETSAYRPERDFFRNCRQAD